MDILEIFNRKTHSLLLVLKNCDGKSNAKRNGPGDTLQKQTVMLPGTLTVMVMYCITLKNNDNGWCDGPLNV